MGDSVVLLSILALTLHRKACTEEVEPDFEHPWVKWATVAIQEVLGEHHGYEDTDGTVYCADGPRRAPHTECGTWEQWREYVSPLIADHLNRARLARNANESFQLGRQWMETGQDMGTSMASEFFPQSTKRR